MNHLHSGHKVTQGHQELPLSDRPHIASY